MSVFFERQFLTTVLPLIKEAKSEILICVYEWVWYDHQYSGTAQDINRAVCTAAKNGVRVRAMLHHDSPNSYLSRLNRKTASRLRKHGVEVKVGSTKKILHAKLWCFDKEKAIVCTHNVSNRSITSNAEAGVLLSDPDEVAKIHCYLENLWGGLRDPMV